MMTSDAELDGFEQRILTDIRGRIQSGEFSSSHATSVSEPAKSRRRLGVVAAGLVAAVAALAGGFLSTLPGGGPAAPAAYAVTAQPDGLVTVHIHRFADAAGLEKALLDNGVHAVVSYAPPGMSCGPMSMYSDVPLPEDAVNINATPSDGSALAVTVSPQELSGYTLVIDTSESVVPVIRTGDDGSISVTTHGGAYGIGVVVVAGKVDHCQLQPLPIQPLPTR